METPNLLKLRAKDNLDQVELCIIYWGDEVSASDDNLEEAEQAATDYLALRARVEALKQMVEKLQFCDFDRCPICSGGKELKYFKHKDGCELEAVLKGKQ